VAPALSGGRSLSPAGGEGQGEGAAPILLHDLGGIEAELDRLWQANAAGAPGEHAVLRAATFNLIVVAPSEDDGQTAGGVLAGLLADHPGRVLVVCADTTAAAERLEAWVTLHCRAIGGGSQVCGEQVVVVAAGGAVDRVAGVVTALLLPDCPAIAWWRGGPGPAVTLLDRLRPSLDAVLLDGGRVDPPALGRWVGRVAGAGPGVAVGDLAWERTRPWRGWTADLFEPPAARAALGHLRAVRVASGAGADTVALLYLAWLAARLGWPATPGLTRRDGGWAGRLGPVAVAVAPDGAGDGLTAITLEAGGARWRLARQDAERVALEAGPGTEGPERKVIRHPEPDDATLVGRWLERPHPDPIYAEALAALAALTGGA